MAKGFMDGYKTYNPKTEGYGDPNQWRDSFNKRMGSKEAKIILGENDPYFILELSTNATLSELKSQYRKMAMKWHPDKNIDTDTTEQMKKIVAAYTLLLKKIKN
ncbi:J domain-containing protein [Candidatus Dojkabacteria bacterium]|jgi:DnaJ-class molecular chaperone|nr:J domain-containing protein [Candidatus Dojkabacteria bacterium]